MPSKFNQKHVFLSKNKKEIWKHVLRHMQKGDFNQKNKEREEEEDEDDDNDIIAEVIVQRFGAAAKNIYFS